MIPAIQEIATRSNSCVTSLTSDQVAGDVIIAGFGDGAIRVYDTRLAPRDTMIRAWRNAHRSWVKNVHMQRGGNRELVSGRCALRCEFRSYGFANAGFTVSPAKSACGIFGRASQFVPFKLTKVV